MLVKSLEMWTESTLKLNFPLTFLTWHPTLPSTCTGAINLPLDGRLSDLMVIWRELSILSPEYRNTPNALQAEITRLKSLQANMASDLNAILPVILHKAFANGL